MLKVEIIEYFDSLRNQLDVFTETKISENLRQEDFWNNRRAKQLQVLSNIEQMALERARGLGDHEGEALSIIGSKFCFVLIYNDMIYVLTTDRHVPLTERKLLIDLLNQTNSSSALYAYTESDTIEKEIESDLLDSIIDRLDTNCEVVDVSSWFHKEYQFESIKLVTKSFSCTHESKFKPFMASVQDLSMLRFRRFILDIHPSYFMYELLLDFPILESLVIKLKQGFDEDEGLSKFRFNVPKLRDLYMCGLEDQLDLTPTLETLSHAHILKIGISQIPKFKGFKCSRLESWSDCKSTLSEINGMDNLTEFIASSYRSLSLEPGAFKGLVNLKKISLKSYSQKWLDLELFDGLFALEKLELPTCAYERVGLRGEKTNVYFENLKKFISIKSI